MIEIKNLCKTYKPKKGPEVVALDNVSLKFGETGMVFILGKSGSGKSTLLNILGGLDRYDSGEFIIEGKSSNEFSQSDLDSYRNTLIGFIFQEYNILDEFTVGANIALAMQLQGKKSTNEALNKILDEVDLTGFGNRKPNELSGGQKQRVAIARALIKDPRIIMADEPTGALDSNTGRQVFDTLKKLSKDKLVIIVSHDREFAEYYGDRVIELADGKIISDISKYEAQPDNVSEGISIVDGRIMQIKKGYKLKDKDVAMINEYLAKAETDALLTVDERSNRNFKQIAMINDDGGKKSFAETDNDAVSDKVYDGAQLKLIKSRLPYKHSLKMGASSLKSKPIKLIFTILLSFIAFALFGVADTLGAYNETTAAVSSITDFNIPNATFTKRLAFKDGYYSNSEQKISDADIAGIKEATGLPLRPIHGYDGEYSFYQNISNNNKLPQAYMSYYQTRFSGAIAVDDKFLEETGFTLIGHLPGNINEIVMPLHLFETFKQAGYKSYDGSVNISGSDIDTPQSFIDRNIVINLNNEGKSAKLVGFIDTKFDEQRFAPLKNPEESMQNGIYNYTLSSELESEIKFGYHAMLYVTPAFVAKTDEVVGKVFNAQENCYLRFGNNSYNVTNAMTFAQAEGLELNIKYIGDLNTKGIVVPLSALRGILYQQFYDYRSDIDNINLTQSDKTLRRLEYNNYNENPFSVSEETLTPYEFMTQVFGSTNAFDKLFCDAILDMDLLADADLVNSYVDLWNQYFYYDVTLTADTITNDHARYALTHAIIYNYNVPGFIEPLYQEIKDDYINRAFNVYRIMEVIDSQKALSYYNNYEAASTTVEFQIIGYYNDNESFNNQKIKNLIVSDAIFANFAQNDDGYIACIAPMPTDRNQIQKIVDYSYELRTDGMETDEYTLGYILALQNRTSASLNNVGSMIKSFAQIFLYIGIGFAVFASLLLMNFISTSISYKKREIGILRAVGARGSDVFGIFLNESMIIALINFVLATIATIICCTVLNGVFAKELGMSITILTFGIRQIALIFFVAIGAAFLASLLPVMKISHKRPIDAIRNR